MVFRGSWTAPILVLLLGLGHPIDGHAQLETRGSEPVIVETPWGQPVVPDLPTFLDIQVYRRLNPADPWPAGDSIRQQLSKEYESGQLILRHFPWRVAQGVFALGKDSEGQLIYLLDTGSGLLLIDPSYDSWQEVILRQIRELNYDLSQVRWVLVTHCHLDHAQSCHSWRDRGAKIFVPDQDAHPVESGNMITAWWLDPEPDRHFVGCPVDVRVYDGDVLEFGKVSLYAIATPGHTPGSTCYYLRHEDKDILFSGDIALHAGRHAWMGNAYADWDQYLRSLEKLVHFSVGDKPVSYEVLLPGHGAVDLKGAQRSVEETLRIVRNIVARRQTGENIDWIDPYPWNWSQHITYGRSH
jgi:glyoxylase-like metal-dependent hydrolase (beta-lactamase superfamily II)